MAKFSSLLNKVQLGYQLWRHFGTGWLLFRLRYALQHRSGWLKRRLPATSWDEQSLTTWLIDPNLADPAAYLAYRQQAAPRFFFAPEERSTYQAILQQWHSADESPIARADQLTQGQLRYFSGAVAEVGAPPEWHRNPFTGKSAPTEWHWSDLSDFGYGDIKVIWEASRFGFVYDLVRAYWRTSNEQYPELFWKLIADWRHHNPPQQGVNWKCGQETSLRLMAWCFGLYGFLGSPVTTAQRVAELAQMIAVSGARIEANLAYALSQRNNHGISEGMGLWTIGLLFPELKQARRWMRKGRMVLEQLANELIYADGAFVQHSLNYQRLMLHDYLWALRLGDLVGQSLSDNVRQQVAKSGKFLYQLQDAESGAVPHYGQDDGALILPLNNCRYENFRPVIQAVHYLVNGDRCYTNGLWDEDLLWLFGSAALTAPTTAPSRTDCHTASGYHVLRGQESFVFTRCGSYRDRPGQADMLHLDLWWRGHNIAQDPGAYSYNAPPPWNNALAGTHYHNTVTVDGQDQMACVGKFLWLPWVQAKIQSCTPVTQDQVLYWEGEHNGYQRLDAPVRYRRAVIGLGADSWLVLDALTSRDQHDYRCHWLLTDAPYQWAPQEQQLTLCVADNPYHIMLDSNGPTEETTLCRADATTPLGWHAPRYSVRQPALALTLTAHAANVLVWTLFSPRSSNIAWQAEVMTVNLDQQQWSILIDQQSTRSLVTEIAHSGL